MKDETEKTLGERIAAEFSADKVNLSEAEQRRLAGMIDAKAGGMFSALSAIDAMSNLPDDRLTDRTGPNDAAHRGLMFCSARSIARAAIASASK